MIQLKNKEHLAGKIAGRKMIATLLFAMLLLPLAVLGEVRYHCGLDSVAVLRLVDQAREGGEKYGDRIVAAAKALIGVPYAGAADNDSVGTIVVRLDSLNQREFIYISMAAAKTAGLTAPTLRDFEKNLENISRKKGNDQGFASQFLYGADWIVDNVYRGNLKEMTEYLGGGGYRTKTLDYVGRHPGEFPAMANPDVAEKIRIAEYGYRSHRIPHMKKQSIGNKTTKELMLQGDIIIMSSLDDDFDIYDIGIVALENGEPTLMHISKETGLVTLDPYPLARLFKIEGQHFYGYRWLRPEE
ncbi:MAG: DUF1460 domain-containing protein [Muribaculaceae bacterium]|nr:DUF1460 domain-containing protein [Muribaculaceae bacterium]